MSDTKLPQPGALPAPDGGDEAFLERWSRRKRSQDQQANTGQEVDSATAVPAVDSPPEEPVLTDADMPPIESLDADSDYSPFMSPGVSEQLRTLALRKLFHQPAFNITDGLNDYDEDFTGFTSLGDTVTHEMKRMLKRELAICSITTESPPSARSAAPTVSAAPTGSASGTSRSPHPSDAIRQITTTTNTDS